MISIVIPTLGRDRYVRQCLDDLDRIGDRDVEVIVIDQNATEDPRPIDKTYSFGLRSFVSDEPNASLARNIGLRKAKGNIVLFLDDDVRILNPNFLRNHRRYYEDPSIPGVYGQVLEVGQEPTHQPEPSKIETEWGWMLSLIHI